MKKEQRFEKVFLKEKWRNTYIVKEYFPLEVIEEIEPTDSYCEKKYGDYLKGKKNLKFFATASKDLKFVAIIIKCDGEKHRRLLEAITVEDFTTHYRLIND